MSSNNHSSPLHFSYQTCGYVDSFLADDLYSLNLDTLGWARLPITGLKPQARQGHTATAGPDGAMWLFGGSSSGGYLSDLWVYHPKARRWEQPHTNGMPPSPRKGHVAALVGSKLFFWGGCGATCSDTRVHVSAAGGLTQDTPFDPVV